MKKIFIALSVLGALLIAAPSMAQNGVPDAVPGYDVQLPFFLVSIPGIGSLDTLMVIQEVGGTRIIVNIPGFPNQSVSVAHGATKGSVHSRIYDRYSVVRGDWIWTYTPDDVYPLSINQAIIDYVGVGDLSALEIDLDGDGVNDHYFGYIYNENRVVVTNPATGVATNWPIDNLIGKMYVVDLPNGIASGANIPSLEFCGVPIAGNAFNSTTFYQWQQWTSQGGPFTVDSADYLEVFSADALAISKVREHMTLASPNYQAPGYARSLPGNPWVATSFAMTPRFFLRSDTAQSIIFLWTDANYGNLGIGEPPPSWHWRHDVNVYDEAEYGVSISVDLPYELNWIDMWNELPGGVAWDAPIGGWIDLDTLAAGRASVYTQWLGYSWQSDVSPLAAVNWGALFEVHRMVGTL